MTSIKLKALLAILLVAGLLLIPSPQPVEAQGWLDGWDKRVEFTIDHDDIDTNVTWFPVLLHISNASGIGEPVETDIDVGSAATNRSTFWTDNFTLVSKDNVANDDGTLDTIEIYAVAGYNLSGCKVGTFYANGTNILICRDVVTIGNVTGGSKQTFTEDSESNPIALTVKIGDHIGLYFSGGRFVADTTGGATYLRLTGDHCIIDDEDTYTTQAGDISLYATGHGLTSGGSNITFVFDEVGANSKKIAITKDDGTTELYGEIESWDATNETADVWTSREGWNISNTTNTTGYLYYDNDHTDNDAYIGVIGARTEVWDGNFVMVQHMVDATTSTIVDSTSNNNDGTKKAANEPIEVAGEIANAQSFDDVDDHILVSDSAELRITGDLTVEAFVKTAATDADHFIFHAYLDSSPFTGFAVGLGINNNFGKITFYSSGGGGWLASTSTYYYDTWNYVCAVLDSTTIRFYGAGATDGTGVSAAPGAYTGNRGIGAKYTGTNTFDGEIDELRVSDIKRLPAWIKASYESERDHLITWGSEETKPTGERSWGYIIG